MSTACNISVQAQNYFIIHCNVLLCVQNFLRQASQFNYRNQRLSTFPYLWSSAHKFQISVSLGGHVFLHLVLQISV